MTPPPDPADLPTDGRFAESGAHWLPVRVYYEDTDFTGMVYHANYLRFFERGRSAHLRTAGISHADLLQRADPAAFTLTRAEIDFRRPARVDDLLAIRTQLQGVNGARIIYRQSAMRGEVELATLAATVVCIHSGGDLDGRPRRPMADLLKQLAPYISGER